MSKLQLFMILAILLMVNSCWEKQDHLVSAPEHPTYKPSGTVSHLETELPVIGAEVSVTMTEVYQGSFLDSMGTITNSEGFYEINDLYRGRYDFLIKVGLDTLYKSEIGLINYADKIVDVRIAPPDSSNAE